MVPRPVMIWLSTRNYMNQYVKIMWQKNKLNQACLLEDQMLLLNVIIMRIMMIPAT